MATSLLCKNCEVLLFIKDSIVVYNTSISNGQNQVFEIAKPTGDLPKNLKESRKVIFARLSKDVELLGVLLDNKQMIIYDKHFNIVGNVTTNRICSSLVFTNENDVVVADKTGDVYLYKLKNLNDCPILLLGHLSMILDVAISNCGKFLITCDRDEKIRVSRFPNCYNIMSYCLGHSEFVTNLQVQGNVLMSGSGDGSVRVWDFLSGKQLSIINTNDYVDTTDIIEDFCKEMEVENVDIDALPVVSLKVYQPEDNLMLLGVTLVNYSGVQMYHIAISPPSEVKVAYKETIMVDSKIVSCSLNLQLFILTYNILHMYTLNNDNTYVKSNSFSLSHIYSNCPFLDMKDEYISNIMTLYKRKYDNVQEYMDRKKLRLATNV